MIPEQVDFLHLFHKWGYPLQIQRRTFDSLEAFAASLNRLRRRRGLVVHHGLSLVYGILWPENVGHALWDGLYPAFVALRQWGRESETFNSVAEFDDPADKLLDCLR